MHVVLNLNQTRVAAACVLLTVTQRGAAQSNEAVLPTGKRITPLATPGAKLESLNPNLPGFPHYLAGQAMSMAISPDGKTLLVLTSGFNRINGPNGKPIPEASNEYVFVYDIS
ncbi:MAG: hypothetical protein JO138_21005, partial [Acidobacteriaceae bacterium]|nr:hypothetical protein [Acidobacteriaceae bacterium]